MDFKTYCNYLMLHTTSGVTEKQYTNGFQDAMPLITMICFLFEMTQPSNIHCSVHSLRKPPMKVFHFDQLIPADDALQFLKTTDE